MTSLQATPAIPEAIHRRRWLILAVLLTSVLVVVLDSSILNVAMKTIAQPEPSGLGATQSQLEWSVNSYTLVFAGLLFTGGLLGDRLGRKKILIFGMLVFGVASAFSAYSGSPAELITFRGVMGFGSAFIPPATLAIVTQVFERAEQPRAIGIWTGVVGLAVAAGPIAGGTLLHYFWWGSVFLVNVPIVIIAVIAMIVWVPESKSSQVGGFDPVGVLLSIAGLVLLIYGIIRGGQYGDFGRTEVWTTGLAGLVILVLFVLWELRSEYPAFDVRFFKNSRFAASVGAISVVSFALLGVTFFVVFYTQSVRGYSPLETGLLLLPLAAAQMFFAPRARHVVTKLGARVTCAGGLVLNGLTFIGFMLLDSSTPIWVLLVLFALMGTAFAHIMPPATVMIMTSLPPEKAGAGSAINNVFRQVGGAIGIAVLGSLLSTVYRHGVQDDLDAVAPSARKLAGESVEGTLGAARALGSGGQSLVDAANSSFIHAMHITALTGGLVSIAGALVVAMILPGKPKAEPATDGDGSQEPQKVGAEK